jgi:methionyl-tRNA formyltransferase
VEGFFRKSEVMQRYFREVQRAEAEVFGGPRLAPAGLRVLPMLQGDLGRMPLEAFGPALDADLFVVFGASYIKGALADHLLARRALNIHMGVSPAYRGSSCNFWALHDGRPDLVGGTVHLLSRGLDSGDILFHCLPPAAPADPFTLGMLAVESAIEGLARHVAEGTLAALPPVPQDKARELRYSRGAEFTDEVAQAYLERLPTPEAIAAALARRDLSRFVRPFVAG